MAGPLATGAPAVGRLGRPRAPGRFRPRRALPIVQVALKHLSSCGRTWPAPSPSWPTRPRWWRFGFPHSAPPPSRPARTGRVKPSAVASARPAPQARSAAIRSPSLRAARCARQARPRDSNCPRCSRSAPRKQPRPRELWGAHRAGLSSPRPFLFHPQEPSCPLAPNLAESLECWGLLPERLSPQPAGGMGEVGTASPPVVPLVTVRKRGPGMPETLRNGASWRRAFVTAQASRH
jgi:hypothetical protein